MSIQDRVDAEFHERFPGKYTHRKIDVVDEHGSGEYEHARVEASLRELEQMGFYGDTDRQRALSRKRKSTIDYENPATKELMARVPGVENWLALVPTPRALSPLYDPSAETLPTGHTIGEELRHWLTEIADARGLRYRSQIVTNIFTDEIPNQTEQGIAPNWLSIASGAAQPILKAAHMIHERTGVAPDMTLIDLSAEALADAHAYAEDLGLGDSLHSERMNVLRLNGLDVPERMGAFVLQRMLELFGPDEAPQSGVLLPREAYDVVEAVGILEYMQPDDWKYRYNGVVNLRTKQAGARTFLNNSYRLVKPGGRLVVGNMLDTHPQLGFTLNTIQWPHIQPRSVDEMMQLFDEAGLAGERTVYVPTDEENEVYALYTIHKPESGGQ